MCNNYLTSKLSQKMKGKRSGFRNTAIAKATGKQTSGAFGLAEHIIPAGAASP